LEDLPKFVKSLFCGEVWIFSLTTLLLLVGCLTGGTPSL